MHVPKQLWFDVILCVGLIECHLQFYVVKVPFSCPDKNMFLLLPRVVGCTCFIQDLAPNLEMLSPRCIKCVC